MLISSLIRVTAPTRARRRPLILVAAPTVIDAWARTLPEKCVPPLSVALEPTIQKTFEAWPPVSIKTAELPTAVVKVEPIWKIQTAFGSPPASRYSAPVIARLEALE